MQVSFSCPGCQQTTHTDIASPANSLACGHCAWTRAVSAVDVTNGEPNRCLVCGCTDLWRQKDFPQKLGLTMVALGALLSTIAWMQYMPLTAIGVLLGFAFIDLMLYTFMPDVLVCYRCAARFRHAKLSEHHPRFNLETSERYRQEAARLAQKS